MNIHSGSIITFRHFVAGVGEKVIMRVVRDVQIGKDSNGDTDILYLVKVDRTNIWIRPGVILYHRRKAND